jgi:hypothetical protein
MQNYKFSFNPETSETMNIAICWGIAPYSTYMPDVSEELISSVLREKISRARQAPSHLFHAGFLIG